MPSAPGTVLVLVGHVTKEGQIAGPRVLEHMVDCVLYFEGERGHQFRFVRAIKNRFGPTDEIGVFEMTDRGLVEIPNPSSLFVDPERGPVPGAAVFAGVEGSRPVLVEIQALVAPGPAGSPRRTVVGWDAGRLAMVLAVLEAPRRAPAQRLRRLPQRGGGPADHGARRRSRGRGGARLVGGEPGARPRRRDLRRGGTRRRGPAGEPGRGPAQGGREARLHPRAGPGAGPRPGAARRKGRASRSRRLTHVRDLVALFPADAPLG